MGCKARAKTSSLQGKASVTELFPWGTNERKKKRTAGSHETRKKTEQGKLREKGERLLETKNKFSLPNTTSEKEPPFKKADLKLQD